MKVIEAYHCDYCKKYSKSKGVITRHEKECYHNPITQACATCENMYQEPYTRPHILPNGTEIACGLSRPICTKGIIISDLNRPESISGHRISLKNNCAFWDKKDETNEEEIY